MTTNQPQQINLVISFDPSQIDLVRRIVQPSDIRDLYTRIDELEKCIAEVVSQRDANRKKLDESSYRAEQAYLELKKKTEALQKAEAVVTMLTENQSRQTQAK